MEPRDLWRICETTSAVCLVRRQFARNGDYRTIYVGGVEPWSRGYGREMSVNIAAVDGSFALAGGNSDGSRQVPGIANGGQASIAPAGWLYSVSGYIPFSGHINGTPFGLAWSDSALAFTAESTVAIPTANDPGGEFFQTWFELPPTRFTLAETRVDLEYKATLVPPDTPRNTYSTTISGTGDAIIRIGYGRGGPMAAKGRTSSTAPR